MMKSELELNKKLDLILHELYQIKEHLNIIPNSFTTIQDIESSVTNYEEYASDELSLTDNTILNHKSQIKSFLEVSNGIINKDTVRGYLEYHHLLSSMTSITSGSKKGIII